LKINIEVINEVNDIDSIINNSILNMKKDIFKLYKKLYSIHNTLEINIGLLYEKRLLLNVYDELKYLETYNVNIDDMNAQKTLNDKITKLVKEITDIELDLTKYKSYKSEYKNNQEKLLFYDSYLTCINYKTGLPSVCFSKISDILTQKCNEYLNEFADFSVCVSFNKDFKLYINNKDSVIPYSMGSGYQKFIIDLILRFILLNNIKEVNLTNCNVLFIDEVLGCLDASNFNKVMEFLQTFKKEFKAIIIISHNENLNSYADTLFNIKKDDNGFSQLQYGNELVNNILQVEKKQMIEILYDEGIFICNACCKEYKFKGDGSVEKHLNGKMAKKKHDIYLI